MKVEGATHTHTHAAAAGVAAVIAGTVKTSAHRINELTTGLYFKNTLMPKSRNCKEYKDIRLVLRWNNLKDVLVNAITNFIIWPRPARASINHRRFFI